MTDPKHLHVRLVSWLWTHGYYRAARYLALGRDIP